jgi:hypothetical protein
MILFVLLLGIVLLLARAGWVPQLGRSDGPSAARMREQAIPWREVWAHPQDFRGETVAVIGRVASTTFLPEIEGAPTFLNLGNPHPDTPRMELVIWEENRHSFLSSEASAPETRYRGRRVCAAGTVSLHEGIPQIELRTPRQLLLLQPSTE